MALLPLIQSQDKDLMLMQSKWKSQLDPVISNQLTNGNLIQNVSLPAGSLGINHLLQRMQVGWIITDQNAAASIYRSLPFGKTTLTLTSNNPVVVSLWCF